MLDRGQGLKFGPGFSASLAGFLMGMNILQCSSIEKLKTADCTSPWVQNLLLAELFI